MERGYRKPAALSVLWQVQLDLGITNKRILLKICTAITSPMLVGFVNPTILLPDSLIHEDELPLILKHESIHYKRRDLWIKALMMLTNAVQWFNPALYLMASEFQADCEASCDEAVLGNTGLENRKLYGEAIIGVIGTKSVKKTAFSSYFYGGKKNMKKRLTSIMNMGKKRIGIALFCGIFVLTGTIVAGATLASNKSLAATSEITADEAKEIALAKTGGGTVTELKLDYEKNNRKVYEIEIINGNTKYCMDIDVLDSQIYDYEEETIKTNTQNSSSGSTTETTAEITPETAPSETNVSRSEVTVEEAKAIALAKTGGGTVTGCNLGYKNGRKVYEIEIINGNIEHNMDVCVHDSQIYDYEYEHHYDHDEDHD